MYGYMLPEGQSVRPCGTFTPAESMFATVQANPSMAFVDSSPSNGAIVDTPQQYVKRWGDDWDPRYGDVHHYAVSTGCSAQQGKQKLFGPVLSHGLRQEGVGVSYCSCVAAPCCLE